MLKIKKGKALYSLLVVEGLLQQPFNYKQAIKSFFFLIFSMFLYCTYGCLLAHYP